MSDGGPLPYLCIAGSGSMLLVVSSACDVFVWEIDHGQSVHNAVKDSSHVCGTWSKVDSQGRSVMLGTASRELAVHAVFSSDPSVCFMPLSLTCVRTAVVSVLCSHYTANFMVALELMLIAMVMMVVLVNVKGKGKGPVLNIALLHDEHMLWSALQSRKWQLIGMS